MRRSSGVAAPARRDLRLALLGGCCTALGGACLLLVACAGTTPRAEPEAPAIAAPLPTPAIEVPAPAPVRPALPVMAPASESPWPRLRASFELPGCGYNAQVKHWTH